MKKKWNLYVLFIACSAILMLVAGCGDKSQDAVVKKIDQTLADLDGYKAAAEMTMNTGKEERSYQVDVWYKKDEEDFYRVGLAGEGEEEGDEGQVILKNKEGVFVLTPSLNKSFKFQTDWPGNNSQPYLYQSLVNDVLSDKEATFSATDDHYVFATKTNYQNNTQLPYQEVYFDKKTYAPIAVKVLDKDKNVLIEVAFEHLDMKPSFAKDDFNRDVILEETLAEASVSTVEEQKELAVTFPLETLGAELVEKEEVALEDGERVIMTFKGERNFTFIQEKQNALPTSAAVEEVQGELVQVGDTLGALSENTVEWTDSGVNYYLASDDMTMEELLEVATTMDGKEAK